MIFDTNYNLPICYKQETVPYLTNNLLECPETSEIVSRVFPDSLLDTRKKGNRAYHYVGITIPSLYFSPRQERRIKLSINDMIVHRMTTIYLKTIKELIIYHIVYLGKRILHFEPFRTNDLQQTYILLYTSNLQRTVVDSLWVQSWKNQRNKLGSIQSLASCISSMILHIQPMLS